MLAKITDPIVSHPCSLSSLYCAKFLCIVPNTDTVYAESFHLVFATTKRFRIEKFRTPKKRDPVQAMAHPRVEDSWCFVLSMTGTIECQDVR